jgi:hypothetical protein
VVWVHVELVHVGAVVDRAHEGEPGGPAVGGDGDPDPIVRPGRLLDRERGVGHARVGGRAERRRRGALDGRQGAELARPRGANRINVGG